MTVRRLIPVVVLVMLLLVVGTTGAIDEQLRVGAAPARNVKTEADAQGEQRILHTEVRVGLIPFRARPSSHPHPRRALSCSASSDP